MTELVAADALVGPVPAVELYARSRPPARGDRAEFYAVYGDPADLPNSFFGVVSDREVARFPRRVFADLLPRRCPPPVRPDAPLDRVGELLAARGVDAVPVVEDRGPCTGVVTRVSLTAAVLRKRGHLCDQLSGELRVLKDANARLEEWLVTSRPAAPAGRAAVAIAHDLSNLMTVLLCANELLRAGRPAGAAVHPLFEEMRTAADAASALTKDLMALLRNDRPPDRPPAQPVNLNAVVEGLAGTLAGVPGGRIELVLDLAPDLVPVGADPHQVVRALLNLAKNARDAMPGGGRLSVRTANVRAEGGGEAGARTFAQLSVTDTGCGMNRETLARAFEPFFTTKPPGRGTGLGLPIVREVVERYGGYVTARSEVGGGTALALHFPPHDRPGDAPRPVDS